MSQPHSTLPLILASASPRRRDLLRAARVPFEIRVAELDETPLAGESPEALVQRLARSKALAVASSLPKDTVRWILGADTIVVIDGKILGKPRDAEDANALLAQILGRTHRVLTGVALIASDATALSPDAIAARIVESRVRMRHANSAEIRAYVATGEPLDKAGAYAVQGEGRKFVEAIEGSETNVIGLPMETTLAWLQEHGLARETTAPATIITSASALLQNSAPTEIAKNIADVRRRVEAACTRARRTPSHVTLLVVSKQQDCAAIAAAVRAGQYDFAENYVQEARAKISALQTTLCEINPNTKLRWHCTGHLQRKKAKEAVQLFDVIQTVDRIELARALDQHAAAQAKILPIYLQVNVSSEPQKSGVSKQDLPTLLQACIALPHLRVEGLMAIPAYSDDPEASRPAFRKLRELRDELVQKFGQPLPELSMGMSGDFEVAIEEGATIVRIGTAIFGAREPQKA